MKTLKHLALCLAAVFIATGCSNDENEPKTGAVKEGKPVKFEMNIGNANTRTVTTGSGSNRSVSWREGDAVGIFVYESTGAPTEYSNKKYEYKDGEWKASGADDAIILPEDGEYTFYAYYPYSASVTTPAAATLSVQQDQTIADGDNGNTNYDLSDILTAKAENITNNATITLQYKHLFSMVEVLVSGDLVSAAPASVVLKDVKTSATINLTTDDISATSDNADVSMCPVESETTQTTYLYRAIVPTQTIEANKPLLEVYGVDADKDKNYRFTHTAAVPYEQGKYRRISVLIGENNAGITIPSGAIDEWEPSGKIDVPGEEIKTIVPPLTSTTQFHAFYNKTAPTTNYGWYYFMAVTEEQANETTADKISAVQINGTQVIEYTINKGASLGWQNQSFGFATTECTAGKYKLSFEMQVIGAITETKTAGVSVFMRDKAYKGGPGVANSFIIAGSEDQSGKARSLYYNTTATGDTWSDKPVEIIFDLTKMTANGPSGSAPVIEADRDKDYSTVFVGMTYNGTDTPLHTIQIRNITLERVTE